MKSRYLYFFVAIALAFSTACSNQTTDTSESQKENSPSVLATNEAETQDNASQEEKTEEIPYEPTVDADNADEGNSPVEESEPANNMAEVTFFSSEDIYSTPYSNGIFSDYDLTLVNLFTTWCPPCRAEMPELERLYNDLRDKGVNIIGFVLDVRDEYGEIDGAALEEAYDLADSLGITYPLIIPDETLMNGLMDVYSVPTTFFVDRNGNIVGDFEVGARPYDSWMEVINNRLEQL